MYSCSPDQKKIFDNLHLLQISKMAEEQHKDVLLVNKSGGCSPCDMFELMLFRNEALQKAVTDKYLVVYIDHSIAGNEWLARILNSGATPGFIFTDAAMKLKGIYFGQMPEERLRQILATLEKKGAFAADRFDVIEHQRIPDEQTRAFVQGSLTAQLQLETFGKSHDSADLKDIAPLLKSSIAVLPTFYNNFLLAQYYKQRNDTVQASLAAEKALAVDDKISDILNLALKKHAHHIVNNNYDEQNEAIMDPGAEQRFQKPIALNKKDSVTITFVNTGKKPLKVENIVSDCTCTVGEFTKVAVPPGEKGTIKVVVSGVSAGSFKRMMRVYSNAVNSPTPFYINGQVN
ncbi:DUF1573 domain-containing protein [Chitinophaga solisilvae]|uniref:DUF1573 domain-containing protein n=1 Tax=Chitinophaga solisilvae TaxID=1233460 RepID=UPI001F3D5C69|nr:DUF1573 domain-containing protein [Chitinophaga solisilvae]